MLKVLLNFKQPTETMRCRVVGDSESTQLKIMQRETASRVHDLSPAQRLGRSVRRQRVCHINRAASEHPHNDWRGEAGRQPASSPTVVDTERHFVYSHTCLSNVGHSTGNPGAEIVYLLSLHSTPSTRAQVTPVQR